MENKSKYCDMYKSRLSHIEPQQIRREELLLKLKRQREELHDDSRNIQEFVKNLKRRQKSHNQKYKDQLQLSEWLKEKPDDLENWFLVPCPKGKRCLVIAEKGSTNMYSKVGNCLYSFRSMLPGDGISKNHVTILDCVYVKKLEKFYVLDTIAYGNQDMINCDTAFRFFWIKSQLTEHNLSDVNIANEYPFVPINFYDMEDEFAMQTCFGKYPQWEDNSPILDGFLFYHKESSYVSGTTPLVGWLLSFMVPEVLGMPVHEEYMKAKPLDYVDYLHFIIIFDENQLKLKNRRKKHQSHRTEKMDDEYQNDENNKIDHEKLEVDNILEHSKILEIDGRLVDDAEYVECS